jgi:hypothetical protein
VRAVPTLACRDHEGFHLGVREPGPPVVARIPGIVREHVERPAVLVPVAVDLQRANRDVPFGERLVGLDEQFDRSSRPRVDRGDLESQGELAPGVEVRNGPQAEQQCELAARIEGGAEPEPREAVGRPLDTSADGRRR